MLFLPYKMDTRKTGIPLFTVIICITCCLVYWQQYATDNKYYDSFYAFCGSEIDRQTLTVLRNVAHVRTGNPCYEIFDEIRNAPNASAKIQSLATNAEPMGLFASRQEDIDYTYKKLFESYREFESRVPHELTQQLAYDPKDVNLVKMVTSTFSHGDVIHLIGNVLFFYIFAASVELIIGNVMFALFVAVSIFGTSLAYSYAMAGVENALPTVGLSGVVMAAVAALGIMIPTAKIRCFFWFFLFFRVFKLPVFFLAVWYIGWDVYELYTSGGSSYINYTAHISGAVIGAFLGAYYALFKKDTLKLASAHY